MGIVARGAWAGFVLVWTYAVARRDGGSKSLWSTCFREPRQIVALNCRCGENTLRRMAFKQVVNGLIARAFALSDMIQIVG
jgi:hypothetical protein